MCLCLSFSLCLCPSISLPVCIYACMYVCLSLSVSLSLGLAIHNYPYMSISLEIYFFPPSLSSSLPSFSPSTQKLFLSLEDLSAPPPLNCPLNSSNTSQDDAAPYASVSRCVNWRLLPWRLIQFCIRVLLYLLLSVAVATNTVCLYMLYSLFP